jgi:tetratricopeptide (TPR) repeat protein
LLKADRKHLHFIVGATLEKLYSDRLEEIAPLLAQHFGLGEEGERGIKYFVLAGDAAARVYANAEAHQHYRNALKLMRQYPTSQSQMEETYIKCGHMCEMTGRYDEALAIYDEMESLAAEEGDDKLRLAALIARATVYCAPTHQYDPQKGEALCAEARQLAHQLNDRAAEAKILWNLMLLNKFVNRWDAVLRYGEEAIAIARELNLRELLAYTLNDIYPAYMVDGRLSIALRVLEESSALWRELNDTAMLGDNLTGSSNLHSMLGNDTQSLKLGEEAYRLNVLMRNSWGRSYSAWSLGQNYAFNGDAAKAISFLEEAIHYGEEAGFRIAPIAARSPLGRLFGSMGQIDRGLKILQEAIDYGQNSMPTWMAIIFATRAQLYVWQNKLTEAAEAIRQSEAVAESLDPQSRLLVANASCELLLAQGDGAGVLTVVGPIMAMMKRSGVARFLPILLYHQARALCELGREGEARGFLMEAHALAESSQYRSMLYPILIALAKLETDPAEARKWLAQAREVILYIIDHSPVDLRDTFLQTPEARYVMERI